MKFFLKTLLAILVAVVIAGAIFLTNLIWFRPWSLNLFYEKAFVEVIFNEPELLTSLGLVEQFGITSHNGKLNDASPAHQQAVIDRWKKDLRQLHEYPLDRQTPSQKLSTRILEWYVADQVEGEKWQFHNYPVNQLDGVTKPVSIVHGEHAPAAHQAGLRVLRDAPQRRADKIRSGA